MRTELDNVVNQFLDDQIGLDCGTINAISDARGLNIYFRANNPTSKEDNDGMISCLIDLLECRGFGRFELDTRDSGGRGFSVIRNAM